MSDIKRKNEVYKTNIAHDVNLGYGESTVILSPWPTIVGHGPKITSGKYSFTISLMSMI